MKHVFLLIVATLFTVACGSEETAAENTEVSSGSEYTEDQWGEAQEAAAEGSEQAQEGAEQAEEGAEQAQEGAEQAEEAAKEAVPAQ